MLRDIPGIPFFFVVTDGLEPPSLATAEACGWCLTCKTTLPTIMLTRFVLEPNPA